MKVFISSLRQISYYSTDYNCAGDRTRARPEAYQVDVSFDLQVDSGDIPETAVAAIEQKLRDMEVL